MELNLRRDLRKFTDMRNLELIPHYNPYAEGSCLVKCGNTHVLCTASYEKQVPHFLKNTGSGWVTAEYGMLPRSTHSRIQRESAKGRLDGRTQEIQRLIGRSLRAVTNLKVLGERQIILDCDVIQADGGTRTASITGAFVALKLAVQKLLKDKVITQDPIKAQVCAISCGIVNGNVMLDLAYTEDSNADVDANFVFSSSNGIIEIQSTAEKRPFSKEEFQQMLDLSLSVSDNIFTLQNNALQF